MKTKALIITSFFLIVSCSSFGEKGKLTKDVKSQLDDPDSFKLLDFKKSYSDACIESYIVNFSSNNAFGGRMKQRFAVVYKNGSFCAMFPWEFPDFESLGESAKNIFDLYAAQHGCNTECP